MPCIWIVDMEHGLEAKAIIGALLTKVSNHIFVAQLVKNGQIERSMLIELLMFIHTLFSRLATTIRQRPL